MSTITTGQNCTNLPLGVSDLSNATGLNLYSVTKVDITDQDKEDSIKLAETEAFIEARKILLAYPIFKRQGNQIKGVRDILTCIEGTKLFALVQVDEKTTKQASKINSQILDSIKNAPTNTYIKLFQSDYDLKK